MARPATPLPSRASSTSSGNRTAISASAFDFLNKIEDGKTFGEHHEFTLDTGWLIERDYKAKKEIKRQVRRPAKKSTQ